MRRLLITGVCLGVVCWGGLRGAADYESLVEIPGTATRGMVAQSVAHVLVIVLIIVANVRFLLQRRAGRGKG